MKCTSGEGLIYTDRRLKLKVLLISFKGKLVVEGPTVTLKRKGNRYDLIQFLDPEQNKSNNEYTPQNKMEWKIAGQKTLISKRSNMICEEF